MITLDHWCILCGVLDGRPPPDGAEGAARRAKAAQLRRRGEKIRATLRKPPARVPRPRATATQVRDRRIAREEAAPGHASPEQIAARRAYFGGRCWMCGGVATLMDHVKPLIAGGSMWPSNLRPACWPCNSNKAGRWPWPVTPSHQFKIILARIAGQDQER